MPNRSQHPITRIPAQAGTHPRAPFTHSLLHLFLAVRKKRRLRLRATSLFPLLTVCLMRSFACDGVQPLTWITRYP